MIRKPVQPAVHGSTQPKTRSFYSCLLDLFTHDQGRPLNCADTEATRRRLARMSSNFDRVQSAYSLTEEPPPKDVLFDVWGRKWSPKTDAMTWRRFPDCYTTGNDDRIWNLSDDADDYKLVWWTTMMLPPDFPFDKTALLEAT